MVDSCVEKSEWRDLYTYYEISYLSGIREKVGDMEYICQTIDVITGKVSVCLPLTGRRTHEQVDWLVATTFHGKQPFGNWELSHLDGVLTNNAASNIAWIPPKQEKLNVYNREQVIWDRERGQDIELLAKRYHTTFDVIYGMLKYEHT